MKKDETTEIFDRLIKKLKSAIDNLNSNEEQIVRELEQWNCNITISQAKQSLNLILKNVQKWYEDYKQSKNILCINLKEYDLTLKESSYMLGETSLIDDLHSEIIDWEIGVIGEKIKEEIKKEGKVIGE